MSPRRKQTRPPQTVLGWVFSDPWRKLGAIALALVSWEYLDTKVNERLPSTLQIRLPGETGPDDNSLHIHISDQDYTLGADDVTDDNDQPVRSVDIEMKGEKATINRLRGRLEFLYRPTGAQLERAKEKRYLDFGASDLQHRFSDLGKDFHNLDSVSMTPTTIRLRIRPNASWKQPLGAEHVQLEYGDSGLQGRLRVNSPEFNIQTVELRGPKEVIENIPTTGVIFRGQVPPKSSKEAPTVRIELELLPKLKGVVTNQTVFVTYQVEPDWQDVDLKNVRITIDDHLLADDEQGHNLFQLKTNRVEVLRLKVKGELATRLKTFTSDDAKRDWVRKHLRLVVYPEPSDLAEPLNRMPRVEFVLLDDFQPQKDRDFRVVGLSSVALLLKNGGK